MEGHCRCIDLIIWGLLMTGHQTQFQTKGSKAITPRGNGISARHTLLALLLATAGSFVLPAAASAASFDCTRTKLPREQLICSDSELSKLDEQLGRAYEERRALLSPRGAELLHRSEVSWLRFVATACPLAVFTNTDDTDRAKGCLVGKYRERLNQLSKVGQRVGPWRFNRLDFYAALPAPDSTGNTAGFYVEHIAYPQIDNADSPQVNVWNKTVEKSLSQGNDGEDESDTDTDYEIGEANEHIISVQWTASEYDHGAAHGGFTVDTQNMILFPNVRPLTAADLFGTDKHWAQTVQDVFWHALLANGWSPPDNQADSIKDQIVGEVIRPDKWLITKDGLQVSFSAYEGGCYACNPGPVTASWADLKPVLSSTAITNVRW